MIESLSVVLLFLTGVLAHRLHLVTWIEWHPRVTLFATIIIGFWIFKKIRVTDRQKSGSLKGFILTLALTALTGLAVNLNLIPFMAHQIFIVLLIVLTLALLKDSLKK